MTTTIPSDVRAPIVDHSTSSTSEASAPATRMALPYVKAPPRIVLPPVPSGVVTVPSATLRGQLPRRQELELMPGVVSDLARFDDYAEVFGKTAPSKLATEQTLTSAYQWSELRTLLIAWERYAHAQEVMAWVNARSVLQRLSSAYALAVTTDSAIAVTYPSLGRLFVVRAQIARRGVAVREANAREVKEGRGPYKGATGKRRKEADAKEALAAQRAAQAEAKPSS